MTKTRIGNILFFSFGLLFVAWDVFALGPPVPPGAIQNPLSAGSVEELIGNVITWLLGLAGILALAALVWGGVLYISGFAEEKNVEQGKEIIKWAIIGLVVVGASYAILDTVVYKLLLGG